jgi:hypothetical protein
MNPISTTLKIMPITQPCPYPALKPSGRRTEADFNAVICLIFQTMKGHSKIVEKNYKVTFL